MNYQILKDIVSAQSKRFETISDLDWNEKFSEDQWSKKEILGHLCDSAFTNIRRFIVTQYKTENIVYDQNFWVKAQNYQNIPAVDIINLWKCLNLQIVNVVENIPNSALENLCDTSKDESQQRTMMFLLEDYIQHLNHHVEKI